MQQKSIERGKVSQKIVVATDDDDDDYLCLFVHTAASVVVLEVMFAGQDLFCYFCWCCIWRVIWNLKDTKHAVA